MEKLASLCCWPAGEDDDSEATERSPLIRSSTFPTYTYDAIEPDEFRVVVLHPAQDFRDDIEIHMQTFKRSDNKYYEAVSYTWGTDNRTDRLLVHDEDFATSQLHGLYLLPRILRYYQVKERANSALDVRTNVVTMLRYLRYKWLPRFIWLDALCINQENMEEKSQQVSQMGDIYRKSGKTLIWLGSSKMYPRPLSALEAATRVRRVDGLRKKDDRGPNKHANLQDDRMNAQDEVIRWPRDPDFREILNLPWFSRRWVIQEVALSPRPRVIFGHDIMSFEEMTYFIDRLRIPRNESLNEFNTTVSLYMLESMTSLQRRNSFHGNSFMRRVKHNVFQRYYQHHPKQSGPPDFIQLLVSMSSAECSDDRDRIYALNSLGGRPTTVDYHDSTDDVFKRFAIEECGHSIETLYCCAAFPSETLPSWAPDWRVPRQWLPIMSFEGRPPSQQLLSEELRQPNPSSRRPVFVDSKTMIVHAIPLTCVTAKGPQLLDGWSVHPWRTLRKILAFYAPNQQPDAATFDVHDLDRLMKTLTAGAIQSGTNLDGWLHSNKTTDDIWRACDDNPDIICNCSDKSFCEFPWLHINVHNILQRITRLMEGRCAFVTHRGDWGIGPASMLSGDQVVALPSCRYPLILRSSMPGVRRSFKIVGDCYITPFEGFDQLGTTYAVRPISIV